MYNGLLGLNACFHFLNISNDSFDWIHHKHWMDSFFYWNKHHCLVFLPMLCSSNFQRGDEEVRHSDLCLSVDTVGTQLTLQASWWHVRGCSTEQKEFIVFACSLNITHIPSVSMQYAGNAFFHTFTHWCVCVVCVRFISFHFISFVWSIDMNGSHHNLHSFSLCGVFSLASWNVL